MSKIVLYYSLSEAAVRAELGAGRPAHKIRQLELDPTPELAKLATISDDGTAKIERFWTQVPSPWYGQTHRLDHRADRVLSDQADACLFLTECQTQIDTQTHKAEVERAARETQKVAEAKAFSAQILALTANDLWDTDGKELPGAPAIGGGSCSPEAEEHRKALYAERNRREQAKREQPEREACAWAAEQGEAAFGSLPLQRAAKEGRKVRPEIQRLVAERFREAVACHATTGVIVEEYNWEKREGVPSADAYRLLDELSAAAAALRSTARLPGVTVQIGPIVRIDVAPRGDADWRTGVVVTAGHPWLLQNVEVFVACESEMAEREQEEGDED